MYVFGMWDKIRYLIHEHMCYTEFNGQGYTGFPMYYFAPTISRFELVV